MVKKDDRARKNEAEEIYREEQREAKRKYCAKKKAKMLENVQEQDVKFNILQKQVLKKKLSQLRRKIFKSSLLFYIRLT